MRSILAITLTAASVASCAPSTERAAGTPGISTSNDARQCFQPDRITNFTRGDAEQVYVKVLGGEVFELNSGGCPDMGRGVSLLIAPTTGIGDRLCVGEDARVSTPNGSFGPSQCRARVVRALTPAEVEALPSRQRP